MKLKEIESKGLGLNGVVMENKSDEIKTEVYMFSWTFLKTDNVLKYLGHFYGHYKTETNFIWLGTIILSAIAVNVFLRTKKKKKKRL